MKTAVRTMLLVAALPLATAVAAAPVCPVKPHHVVRVHKVVQHGPGGIGIVVDQARLVTFPEPVKTLYVGNPFIADIQMVDAQHAFVLGKTFGVTNLIAMSANGKEVSNQQVTVLNNRVAVTVNRGADQFNYACNLAHCESAPRPGDQKEYVSGTEQAATAHESVASAATTGGAQTASNQ